MSTKQKFLELSERLSNLSERRAVLVSQEKQKLDRRENLKRELEESGIDTSRPEEEMKRIEAEIDEEYASTKREIDDFEAALFSVSKGTLESSKETLGDLETN